MFLAAFYFKSKPWKENMLKIARGLLPDVPMDYLSLRVTVRAWETRCSNALNIQQDALLANPRINVMQGSLYRRLALQQMEKNQLAEAQQTIDCFVPLNTAHPSSIEALITRRMDVLRGQIKKLNGHFHEAFQSLWAIEMVQSRQSLNRIRQGSQGIDSITPNRVSQICTIFYELDMAPLARLLLKHYIMDLEANGRKSDIKDDFL